MSLKAAMWVHGMATQAENPAISEGRRGWGKQFDASYNNEVGWVFNWFHIPLPTPVILDDIRPRLAKVFVFYNAQQLQVTAIHIYDGPSKVSAFEDLGKNSNLVFSGDHSNSIDACNSWIVDPPLEILLGAGISVQVASWSGGMVVIDDKGSQQWSPPPDQPSTILFTAAGGDFVVPE